MRQLLEEWTKERWYTSSVPVSHDLKIVDGTKPCIIKAGVHYIRIFVQELSFIDQIKHELQYDEKEGRFMSDRTFDGTQWIEIESPFSDSLNFRKHDDGIQLGGERLLGLTRCSFWAFHQDLKPPQFAACTLFGGR